MEGSATTVTTQPRGPFSTGDYMFSTGGSFVMERAEVGKDQHE